MCGIILDLGKWIMRCHLPVVFFLHILSQEDILFSEAYCDVYAILVEGIMCNLFESILKLIQMLFKGKVCAQQTTNDAQQTKTNHKSSGLSTHQVLL